MLYEIYDDIYVVKRIKCIVFDGWVISLVWIAPTQLVKSSNLSKVVVGADTDGLPCVGPNRLMRI